MIKNPKRLGVVVAVSGVAALIYALANNPTDTSEKMKFMSRDMDALIAKGGRVVYQTRNSKYGSALIYEAIDAKTWTPQLEEDYVTTLKFMGWAALDASNGDLCKDGVVAEIEKDLRFPDGKTAVGISMTYNASTIRRCARH